jgi:hypothetical protein
MRSHQQPGPASTTVFPPQPSLLTPHSSLLTPHPQSSPTLTVRPRSRTSTLSSSCPRPCPVLVLVLSSSFLPSSSPHAKPATLRFNPRALTEYSYCTRTYTPVPSNSLCHQCQGSGYGSSMGYDSSTACRSSCCKETQEYLATQRGYPACLPSLPTQTACPVCLPSPPMTACRDGAESGYQCTRHSDSPIWRRRLPISSRTKRLS